MVILHYPLTASGRHKLFSETARLHSEAVGNLMDERGFSREKQKELIRQLLLLLAQPGRAENSSAPETPL